MESAASMKSEIRSQAWAGMGIRFIRNETRKFLYWLLVVLYLVIGGFSAWTEDFPGQIRKPVAVWGYDIGIHVLEFVLEIGHGWCRRRWPVHARGLQIVSGLTGLAGRVGRAFLIAATVQRITPVVTDRDGFNAVGPGVVQGVKWAFGLMALPSTDIPLTGPGEPFESFRSTGQGLNHAERRALLAVVQSSPIHHETLSQYYLQNQHNPQPFPALA
ncbi:hypothetical protein Q9L58_007829 [Maublancomyces gigas]|uniref:Uncharacterized protein n=1 Tax=Discina gigas TaxID=1032678 RepID=A0ABR3GBD4_9PEZI